MADPEAPKSNIRLWGDMLREGGVLLFVFAFLEQIRDWVSDPTKFSSRGAWFLVACAAVSRVMIAVGMVFERHGGGTDGR